MSINEKLNHICNVLDFRYNFDTNEYRQYMNNAELNLNKDVYDGIINYYSDILELTYDHKDKHIISLKTKVREQDTRITALENDRIELKQEIKELRTRNNDLQFLLDDKMKLILRQCIVSIQHKLIEKYMGWSSRKRRQNDVNNLNDFNDYLEDNGKLLKDFEIYMKECKIDETIFKRMKSEGNEIAHPEICQNDIDLILNRTNDIDNMYIYKEIVNVNINIKVGV